jgi:hypothetical protein
VVRSAPADATEVLTGLPSDTLGPCFFLARGGSLVLEVEHHHIGHPILFPPSPPEPLLDAAEIS